MIVDILESQSIEVCGFIDDDIQKESFRGRQVLHDVQDYGSIIIGVGNNEDRKKIAERLVGAKFSTAIHSSATVSSFATIGDGSVVMPGAVINSDSRIGRHCIINTKASVDHDCIVGDFVHISPGVVLCGNVTVGEGTQVGAGATILPGVSIGKWAMIGAGAVVVRDIPDGVVAVGVPVKVIKYKE